ncbi:MAG: DUF3078 domain-containing protein [Prevotellaceae bacterium]|jgi:hypothetical protein|nr:DUF3078 domain-containing protein [Prevotellaceae bacterium]
MIQKTIMFVSMGLFSCFSLTGQTVNDSIAQQTLKVASTVSSVVNTTISGSGTLISSLENSADTTAKPSCWKFSGVVGLNSSLTGLRNWAAGGNNTAGGVVNANLTLRYQKKNMAWESNLDTDFGLTYIDKTTYTWRKTNDKLNFSSKFGYEFKPHWYLTVLGVFKSQYTRGYDYKVVDGVDTQIYTSTWLSPSYTDISLGIDWKPSSIFSFYLSPIAGRISTATDSLLRKSYGIAPDKNHLSAFGATFKGGVNYQYQNLKIISSLTLFTPYTHKPFGNVDVDWDVHISYQLLKMLNITLGTSLKYYDAVMIADASGRVRAMVQFKTNFGIGLGYSF